jgi:hypothetical protein
MRRLSTKGDIVFNQKEDNLSNSCRGPQRLKGRIDVECSQGLQTI